MADRINAWLRPGLALALWMGALASQATGQSAIGESREGFETVSFPAADGVTITADLYRGETGADSPLIVLCHQANWSRGEYREIAPKLVDLGFRCLAIDQRSGGSVNQVANETKKSAAAAGKPTTYIDAEQDILAALKFVRDGSAKGKVILWGSSYSAALALRIAGEHPRLVDGVLSFAPGEYFTRLGKPKNWIAASARKIRVPVLVTSARKETPQWDSIYEAIDSKSKSRFIPKTDGNHGSRALWEEFADSSDYWSAVEAFLTQFN